MFRWAYWLENNNSSNSRYERYISLRTAHNMGRGRIFIFKGVNSNRVKTSRVEGKSL